MNASLLYRIPALIIVSILIMIVITLLCLAAAFIWISTEPARYLAYALEYLIHLWLRLLQ